MAKMGREKGKRGEQEVCKLLQPTVDAVYARMRREHPTMGVGETPKLQRNALQADGGGYDIVGLPWLALEVKCCETFEFAKWWQQTVKQAGANKVPVLVYRRNGYPWRVRMRVTVKVLPYSDTTWNPLVDISVEEFVNYLSLKAFDELGLQLYADKKRKELAQR